MSHHNISPQKEHIEPIKKNKIKKLKIPKISLDSKNIVRSPLENIDNLDEGDDEGDDEEDFEEENNDTKVYSSSDNETIVTNSYFQGKNNQDSVNMNELKDNYLSQSQFHLQNLKKHFNNQKKERISIKTRHQNPKYKETDGKNIFTKTKESILNFFGLIKQNSNEHTRDTSDSESSDNLNTVSSRNDFSELSGDEDESEVIFNEEEQSELGTHKKKSLTIKRAKRRFSKPQINLQNTGLTNNQNNNFFNDHDSSSDYSDASQSDSLTEI